MIETFPDYRDDRDISNITIFFIPISIWYRGANDEFYIATNSTNCKLLNQVKDTSAKVLERAINLVENKYQNVPISSSFFSKWCLPPPIEIQEAWKRQIPDGGSRKFKKDARKEQRLWAFWVAITRSVLKLLTPVILFCISPLFQARVFPFVYHPLFRLILQRITRPEIILKCHPVALLKRGTSYAVFSREHVNTEGGGRRRRKGTMPKSWRGRKGFLLLFFFFWRKERTNFCPLYSSLNLERLQEGNRYTLKENEFERNVSRILESRDTSCGNKYKQRVFGCFYHETLGKLLRRYVLHREFLEKELILKG